jgi:hypothetical protein
MMLLDAREKVMAWLLIPVVSLTIGMMLKDVIVSADKLSKYSFTEYHTDVVLISFTVKLPSS